MDQLALFNAIDYHPLIETWPSPRTESGEGHVSPRTLSPVKSGWICAKGLPIAVGEVLEVTSGPTYLMKKVRVVSLGVRLGRKVSIVTCIEGVAQVECSIPCSYLSH